MPSSSFRRRQERQKADREAARREAALEARREEERERAREEEREAQRAAERRDAARAEAEAERRAEEKKAQRRVAARARQRAEARAERREDARERERAAVRAEQRAQEREEAERGEQRARERREAGREEAREQQRAEQRADKERDASRHESREQRCSDQRAQQRDQEHAQARAQQRREAARDDARAEQRAGERQEGARSESREQQRAEAREQQRAEARSEERREGARAEQQAQERAERHAQERAEERREAARAERQAQERAEQRREAARADSLAERRQVEQEQERERERAEARRAAALEARREADRQRARADDRRAAARRASRERQAHSTSTGGATAVTTTAGSGRLRVDGRRVIDAFGATVALRGVIVRGLERARPDGESFAPVLTGEEARTLSDWGATAVTIATSQDLALEGHGDAHADDYLSALDTTVAAATAAGLRAVVQLTLLSSELEGPVPCVTDAGSIDMWAQIARRYAHEPGVLFDLFATPRDPVPEDWTALVMPHLTWPIWERWVLAMLGEIKRVNPGALAIVRGIGGGDLTGFPLRYGDGTRIPNVIYAAQLAPGEPTAPLAALRRLGRRAPVAASPWVAAGAQDGRVVETLGRRLADLGAHWMFSGWREPALALAVLESDHLVPTRIGRAVQLALAQPGPAGALRVPRVGPVRVGRPGHTA